MNFRQSATPLFLTDYNYSAWKIIKLFWQSPYKKYAYLYSFLVIAITVFIVGMEVALSYWYEMFYNALQAYDKAAILKLIGAFCLLATVFIILLVYRYYFSQLLNIRWRIWLTQQFIDRWLYHKNYYYLETLDKGTDNPEQRIQEDISALVATSINLTLGLINAFTTIFAFIYILWSLSGTLHLNLGVLGQYKISGYLVWVGVSYAIIGTLITFKIGRPLINLNFEQQKREAYFRVVATDLRMNAENIALYNGEMAEKNILNKKFNQVVDNYFAIILRQKLLLWFTAGYRQSSVILPLLVVLPNYLNKVFMLGGLMQAIKAFDNVQTELSFLILSYTSIAEWQAINQRLTSFLNHLNASATHAKAQQVKIITTQNSGNYLQTEDIKLFAPNNKLLLQNISITFDGGKKYLLTGKSGIGKTTFLRLLAGIWPYAEGQLNFPKQFKPLFLSQKPFMSLGSLQESILFPAINNVDAQQLKHYMGLCNLEYLIPFLHDEAIWKNKLSPGEEQRIALLRILINKPNWIFLDESTSMLDHENEEMLYRIIKQELSDATIVSVAHRSSVKKFHDVEIDMEQYL